MIFFATSWAQQALEIELVRAFFEKNRHEKKLFQYIACPAVFLLGRNVTISDWYAGELFFARKARHTK